MTHSIFRNTEGAVVIETAIVAPILLILALGGFEASSLVARQSELQSAVAEAMAIVQAAPPEDAAQRATIGDVIRVSTGLEGEQVVVSEIYRCGTSTSYTANKESCGNAAVSTFVRIALTDRFEPSWTKFGISKPFDYNVERMVQVS